MKYFLSILLLTAFLFFFSGAHVANAIISPVPPVGAITPTLFCLGSCPTAVPTYAPSSVPTNAPSTAPSTATSVAPSQIVSSAPSQTVSTAPTSSPSPSTAPCTTSSSSVSAQSVSSRGSVSALKHGRSRGHGHGNGGGKKHASGGNGLLQQFMQFLLQLLQLLFQQLGINFPIPGSGSGCPTPVPSSVPSSAPTNAPSSIPSSVPSGGGGGGPSGAPSANPSTGVPTPTIFDASPSPSTTVTAAPTGGNSGGATQKTNCTPAKNATMTNTVSSKCGFPDTTNTGATGTLVSNPKGPSANTGSGWVGSGGNITVNTNGAVVKNISITGTINVQAANVTIDNVKIISPATQWFGIALRGATNVVIEHSTIAGTNATSGRMEAAIKDIEEGSTFSANSMIKANNIYYVGTGIQVDHGTIEDNYIHDMGMISGDHINGTTSNSSDGMLMTIQHNTIFNQFDQTDAISLFEDFGVQDNRVINDNLVAGGGYCMYGGQNPGGPAISNIRITNNHFSKMYFPECGGQGGGIIAAFTTSGKGNVWSGNVWDETGATIPF